ncbi:hypothetical protein DMH02_000625 [Streptomyces sp. WAC 00631]|uniref:hypothetical protein n=1 Tax=Streptomyces sp. WAC 00631 TaxID=2203201 RepID=UPI000F7A48DD|nr:hypothetical protein [Streptomyces sp. WAC 00631]MCC5031807.1 hypothetical protein [Streptomyces sp. WAC 00631]
MSGRRALLVLALGTAVSTGGGAQAQDLGIPVRSGPFTTAQSGEHNLDCGNSHDLLDASITGTTSRRERCAEREGGGSGTAAPATALGGTALGPQFTTAQTGRQNLNCGNSADVVTVNVLATVEEEIVCESRDHRTGGPGESAAADRGPSPEGVGTAAPATALGGTALGPQFTTAQTGRQNLNCGNSADVVTVNVLSRVRKRTTCLAEERAPATGAPGHGPGTATAGSGTALGPRTTTAQTGEQNVHCGAGSDLVGVPLGRSEKDTTCRADRATGSPG